MDDCMPQERAAYEREEGKRHFLLDERSSNLPSLQRSMQLYTCLSNCNPPLGKGLRSIAKGRGLAKVREEQGRIA